MYDDHLFIFLRFTETLSKSTENNNSSSRPLAENNNQSQTVLHSLSQSQPASHFLSQSQPVTHSVNGRSRSTDSQSRSSMDSLDSVESSGSGSHKSSGGAPVATPRGKVGIVKCFLMHLFIAVCKDSYVIIACGFD